MSFIPTDLSMLENAIKSLYVLYTRQRLPHDWNETTKHLQMASISKQQFLNFEITHKKTTKKQKTVLMLLLMFIFRFIGSWM